MKMAIGIVINDVGGSVVAARASILPYIVDPTTAEVVVVRYAVSSLNNKVGGGSIILEGDSFEVVSALRKEDSCNWVFGQLLDDIKACCSHFLTVGVMHVRWDANKTAHVLTKCVISLDKVWIEKCPFFIHGIVLAKRDDYLE
jgi:hypothetical protein